MLNETAAAKYTALCWEGATYIRFAWGLIGSSIIIFLLFSIAFGDIIFKAIVED